MTQNLQSSLESKLYLPELRANSLCETNGCGGFSLTQGGGGDSRHYHIFPVLPAPLEIRTRKHPERLKSQQNKNLGSGNKNQPKLC